MVRNAATAKVAVHKHDQCAIRLGGNGRVQSKTDRCDSGARGIRNDRRILAGRSYPMRLACTRATTDTTKFPRHGPHRSATKGTKLTKGGHRGSLSWVMDGRVASLQLATRDQDQIEVTSRWAQEPACDFCLILISSRALRGATAG
jgi:hypothetical protein